MSKTKLFLSQFEKTIDARGRISCPNTFKDVLATEDCQVVILLKSKHSPAIDAFGISVMHKLNAKFDQMCSYSFLDNAQPEIEEIFANVVMCPSDSAGRFTVPPEFLEHAKISENILFVGRGSTFQLWNPEIFRTKNKNLWNPEIFRTKNKNS